MRGIRHGGDEARIDHGSSKPEKKTADEPPAEAVGRCGQEQASGLNPHASDDQALASPAIAQRACGDLQNAPCRGIDGLEHANALDAEPEGGEIQREYPPAHAVIEVVDETGLGCREEIAIAKRSQRENLPESN